MQAKDLLIGQRFETKNCKATLRDLICLRKSYTAIYVSCEQRPDIHSPWKRMRDYIACESEVEPKDEIIDISHTSAGGITFDLDKKDKNVKGKTSTTTGKRGRKSVVLEFPKHKFTIYELAEKHTMPIPTVYLKVREAMKRKEIEIVGAIRKEGARGKPTTVYKITK